MNKPIKGYYMIPAARRDAVNKELEQAGLGPDFFSVRVRMGSGKSATHYAASCSLHPRHQVHLAKVIKTTDTKQAVEDRLSRKGILAMLSTISAKEKKPVVILASAE